jgi:hypothetical protein
MIVRKIVIRFCNNIRNFSNEINKRGRGILFCEGWNFSKSVSVDSTFIREMRVCELIINNMFIRPLRSSLAVKNCIQKLPFRSCKWKIKYSFYLKILIPKKSAKFRKQSWLAVEAAK